MAGPEEIGKAKITIEGDISSLKDATQEAKKEVDGIGDAAEQATDRAGGGFDSLGGKIEKTTSGFRKLSGAVSGAVGAVTALIGVVGLLASTIGTIIVLLRTKQKRLEESRESYADIAQAINDFKNAGLTNEIDKQAEAFERVISKLEEKGKLIGATATLLRGLLDEAVRLRKEQERSEKLDAIRAQRAQEELQNIRNQAALVKELNALIQEQDIQLLPDDEQLRARAEKQKEIIRSVFADSPYVISDEDIEKALANVDRIADRELQAQREREREKDEAQAKRDADSARRLAEAAEQAAELFSERLNATAGSNLTTRLDTIVAELREVTSAVGRR